SVVSALASVKWRRAEIEAELAAQTGKVISEQAKAARPQLEKMLGFAKLVERQANQKLSEGPAEIRAEAQRRLEQLLEPINKAEGELTQVQAQARPRIPGAGSHSERGK